MKKEFLDQGEYLYASSLPMVLFAVVFVVTVVWVLSRKRHHYTHLEQLPLDEA